MSNADDSRSTHFDYATALQLAYEEALRSLTIRYRSISYVAYVHDFNDYCFCEFVQSEAGWVKTIRSLAPKERLPGEEIPSIHERASNPPVCSDSTIDGESSSEPTCPSYPRVTQGDISTPGEAV